VGLLQKKEITVVAENCCKTEGFSSWQDNYSYICAHCIQRSVPLVSFQSEDSAIIVFYDNYALWKISSVYSKRNLIICFDNNKKIVPNHFTKVSIRRNTVTCMELTVDGVWTGNWI
jgi:hypothetical protein